MDQRAIETTRESEIERRQAKEGLHKIDDIYRIVSDFASDWIFLKDANGEILYISPACLEITGYGQEEFFKTPELLDTIIHPDDRSLWDRHAYESRHLHKDNTCKPLEFRILTKQGDTRWISHSCKPVIDSTGTFLGMRGSNRDITERKRAEEEIRKLNEDLKRHTVALEMANKDLDSFSSSVSHDLRTPLVAIGGFSRLLLERYSNQLDANGKQFLNIIQAKTQNALRLIDNLLTFSRLGRQEIRPVDIDMSELVRAALGEVLHANSEPRIQFNIKTLQPAHGDTTMIRQVFINLLSNAIKFSKPKDIGVIEIGCTVKENKNIYYVKDNGVGFDMKYADKLFDVFQRLHSAEEFEGTGVGLSIVQRIIQRHGGQVWAEGKVNQGAIFYFALPSKK